MFILFFLLLNKVYYYKEPYIFFNFVVFFVVLYHRAHVAFSFVIALSCKIFFSLQQNTNTEIKAVQKNLENTESELDKNEEECSKLRISVESEHQANVSLKQLITKLEKELNEEKSNSLNVQKTLTRYVTKTNR